VKFPLEGFLTVSNVQEQSAVVDLSYNLIGTVNYKAKTKGGHYTAITKNADNWYCYDDHLVSILSKRK
jgi:ubiquitin C-terminal hydrolase